MIEGRIFSLLVAITDGAPQGTGVPLAPRSVVASTVPVTRGFDPRKAPIGRAILWLSTDRVHATVELFTVDDVSRLTPALGGQANEIVEVAGVQRITRFVPFVVALCDGPNEDGRIPTIGEQLAAAGHARD